MIEQLLDLTNYATDTRVARRKTGKKTNEFFKCDFEYCRPIPEKHKKSKNHQTKQLSHIEQYKC